MIDESQSDWRKLSKHIYKTIKIKPDNYDVFLIKEGYGSTQFKVESWVTARNGKCIADNQVWSCSIIPESCPLSHNHLLLMLFTA